MRFALLLLGVLMAGLLFAACGSDDDDGGNVAPVTSESPDDDAGDADTPADDTDGDLPADDDQSADDDEDDGPAVGISLPDSTLAAPLTDTYDTSGAAVSDETLPVPSGSVVARWYQSDGLYVVYYDGLDLAVSGPLCPGNSIETATGFDFISNAPTGDGACSTATTLVAPPTGVRLCGGDVLYLTAIPVDTEGSLFGTIERYRDDGSLSGLTSQVMADSAAAPEVDLSACETP